MSEISSLKLLIALVALSLFSSCGEESADYDVVPEIEPYVQRFVQEAAKYGHVIDFTDTGLSIVFRDAVDKETGGVCRGNHNIEIERFYWNGLIDFEKEGLIFHELGHCELMRGHRNDRLPNGEWASRMRGDPLKENENAVINYAGTRLDYYREELFNENLAFPEWSNWTFEFDDFDEQDKEVLYTFQGGEEFDTRILGVAQGNFEIDLEMRAASSERFVGVKFMGNDEINEIRVGYTRDGNFAIDSGNQIWGIMFYKMNWDKLNPDFNRITIRRVDAYYQVFLNGEFIYWFDYTDPRGEVVASLNYGVLGSPEYKYVNVSKLP